jgi:hypothetical protein
VYSIGSHISGLATASAGLGYVANLGQVVCTLLLIECVEGAVKAGSIGGIELSRM